MSDKKRIQVSLSPEYIDKLNEVMEQIGTNSNGKALEYLIDYYEERKSRYDYENDLVERFLNAFDEKYHNKLERVRWASQTSEMNSEIMLNALNTLLVVKDVNEVILADTLQAPVVKESVDVYKARIAHFKEEKDNRKRKTQTK